MENLSIEQSYALGDELMLDQEDKMQVDWCSCWERRDEDEEGCMSLCTDSDGYVSAYFSDEDEGEEMEPMEVEYPHQDDRGRNWGVEEPEDSQFDEADLYYWSASNSDRDYSVQYSPTDEEADWWDEDW